MQEENRALKEQIGWVKGLRQAAAKALKPNRSREDLAVVAQMVLAIEPPGRQGFPVLEPNAR